MNSKPTTPAKKIEETNTDFHPRLSGSGLTDLAPMGKGRIYLLGNNALAAELKQELSATGHKVMSFPFVSRLMNEANGQESAIIYCAPLQRSEILSVHKNLSKKTKFKHTPFFAVVPSYVSNFHEREMYRRGISMIFEWPRDKKSFQDQLVKAIQRVDSSKENTDTDSALTKAIHLKLETFLDGILGSLGVEVYNGIAMLSGTVKTMDKKLKITSMVKKIPGVRGVVDRSLKVGTNLEPEVIEAQAEGLIAAMEGVPEETLDIKVTDGGTIMELRGTVSSHITLSRVNRRLRAFKDIPQFENSVEVNPRKAAEDLRAAKEAQRMADVMSLGNPGKLHVKVINGIAIVTGAAPNNTMERQITKSIKNIDGIKKVNSQIESPALILPV